MISAGRTVNEAFHAIGPLLRHPMTWIYGLVVGVGLSVLAAQASSPSPVVAIAFGVVWFAANLMLQVAWMRRLLLGEDRFVPRFGRLELRTLAVGLLFLAIAVGFGLAVWALSLVLSLLSGDVAVVIGITAMIAGVAALVWIWTRMTMCFPAAAVDEPDWGLAGAWRRTQGQGWRMMLAYSAVFLLVMVIMLVFGIAQAVIAFFLPEPAVLFLSGLVQVVSSMPMAGAIASVYRSLEEGRA
jgi:hypothetical protein